MAFRNLFSRNLIRYCDFFYNNNPAILASTTFAGSVTGATVAYYGVDSYKGSKADGEKKSVWDYGKIGLSACVGGIAGAIVGVLLEPVIIPCAVVGGVAGGVAKAYDTVKGR
jgi:hypothetical protein